MRRAVWSAVTLLLMGVSFAVGRMGDAFRSLPAMVATLPGDEARFSHEFDDRIRARFLIGSSEDALVAYLVGEHFAPEWRQRDAANSSVFVMSGLICKKIVRVNWRADAAGILTESSGAYESRCL